MSARAKGDAARDGARWTLTVPQQFARDTVQRSGPAGGLWLDGLASTFNELSEAWDLTPTGPVMHGYLGLVVHVVHDGLDFALKLSEPSSHEFRNQVASLREWRGRGMVRLERVDLDRGAILMEWLDHTSSLAGVDIGVAVTEAGALLRSLSVPAAASTPVTTLAEHVRGWPERWDSEWERLGRPLPRPVLDAATAFLAQLLPGAANVLVDHDLHYRDILRSARGGWVAVDPKGLVGDPEFSLGPLMWNRFEDEGAIGNRFRHLVDVAALDHDRALGWLLVSVVDFFLWATGAGLTRDPAACRAVADWVVRNTP